MRDRAGALGAITEALPEVMRRLAGSRPITAGDWELTIAQARALRVVARRAGEAVRAGAPRSVRHCTMGELAARLGVSLSAATGLTDRLVERKLIAREDDPKDRRLVRLRLAEAGKRARGAFEKENKRRMKAALRHLSEQELEQVAGGLALLLGALRQEVGSCPGRPKGLP